MNAKEYIQELDQKNSHWEMCLGIVSRLNNTLINTDNVYMVFWCTSCDGDDGKDYHIIPYTDLKIDKEGDYLACCPNEDEDEEPYCENYLSADCIPVELKKLFESTEFESFEGSKMDKKKKKDKEEKRQETSPGERIIKSGSGSIVRA